MADLALILADAADTAENRSMLTWTAWATEQGIDLAVVAWLPGPLLDQFAAVVPTLDASAVNRWKPAIGLARLGLTPLSRFLKGRRLRGLLEPIGDAPALLVSGGRGLDALDWLPPRDRRVVAQLWPGDLPLPGRTVSTLAGCTAIAVASDEVAGAVSGGGPGRVVRSGLMVGPGPERPVDGATTPGVAVVGIPEDRGEDFVEAARAIRRERVDEQVFWVRRDPDERWMWSLFGDARVADLAGRVDPMAPEEIVGATVVLVAGRGDTGPAIQAARAGVPVLSLDDSGSPVGERHADLAAAAARIDALVDGPERAAVVAGQTRAAGRHAVEVMGQDLLDLVRGA